MNIDIATIIFTILNFLILYIFLKHKLFKGVSSFINTRRENIENQIKETESNLKSSREIKKSYEKSIENIQEEGKEMVKGYKDRADRISEDIIKEAKNEAAFIIERARKEAEREMGMAKDEMKRQIVYTSLLAASKIINEQLDEKKHHALIKEFIDSLGA